ncbi:hypothetical protein IGJ01_000943 [Enterococcus sp. AZ089]|uniref:helix-turn-helix domain-containing protein n=1 Tax=unclassified Enterococcus TaxID=2608891 RepID=UPI003D2FA35A
MIESYIEKDIMRQVKLTEYFLDLKELNISEVAKKLNVNATTIKRDFEKLSAFLEHHILNTSISSKTISIEFKTDSSYYTLVRELYNESKFLRVCARYLMGEQNYLDIVENEFVSVTKAFHLKKKVEEYFIASGIMDKKKTFLNHEFEYRLVILSIWMRSDLLDGSVDKDDMSIAKKLTNTILSNFLNNPEINHRDYKLLLLGTYLSVHRENKSNVSSFKLPISSEYLSKITTSSLTFEKINSINYKILKDCALNTEEIVFLSFIYKSLSLNTTNYLLVETNYFIERNFTIATDPNITRLIRKLEYEFSTSLLNDISFEKPFLTFINSLWNNTQNFIVDKHYYLTNVQIDCLVKIKKAFNQWKNELNLSNIKISEISFEKFCVQATASLLKESTLKTIVIIVAKDELSHVIYRENLKRWLNLDFNSIDDIMYYDIDSIPIYIKSMPHIIICERSLLVNKKENNHDVFEISIPTINKDLKRILYNLIDRKLTWKDTLSHE